MTSNRGDPDVSPHALPEPPGCYYCASFCCCCSVRLDTGGSELFARYASSRPVRQRLSKCGKVILRKLQGDQKSFLGACHIKTTPFVHKKNLAGHLKTLKVTRISAMYTNFSHSLVHSEKICFLHGKKFEIALRDKQKQIKFLFSSISTQDNLKKFWGPKNFCENFIK